MRLLACLRTGQWLLAAFAERDEEDEKAKQSNGHAESQLSRTSCLDKTHWAVVRAIGAIALFLST